MMTREQSMIWGHFGEIMDQSRKLVLDYEKIFSLKELQQKFPQVEIAYTDSIIVHVAKIFSNSKNESFRLARFKTICRAEIKKELEDVENKYKDIIGKIITNRHKLVVHLDKNFYKMPFSENEIKRMAQDLSGPQISLKEAEAVSATMPRTTDKSKERYTTRDFRDDLPQIKRMLEKLNDIWIRSIPFI